METKTTKNPVGRPPKEGVKRTFYLDKEVADMFDEFCVRTARNKTKVAEVALVDFIQRHKDEMI